MFWQWFCSVNAHLTFIHTVVSSCTLFMAFYLCIIPHCMFLLFYLPTLCQFIFLLFPDFWYHKNCCCKHCFIYLLEDICKIFCIYEVNMKIFTHASKYYRVIRITRIINAKLEILFFLGVKVGRNMRENAFRRQLFNTHNW